MNARDDAYLYDLVSYHRLYTQNVQRELDHQYDSPSSKATALKSLQKYNSYAAALIYEAKAGPFSLRSALCECTEFEVTIVPLMGPKRSFIVRGDTLVLDLYRRVAFEVGYDVLGMRLLYESKWLPYDKELMDYDIDGSAAIYCITE